MRGRWEGKGKAVWPLRNHPGEGLGGCPVCHDNPSPVVRSTRETGEFSTRIFPHRAAQGRASCSWHSLRTGEQVKTEARPAEGGLCTLGWMTN